MDERPAMRLDASDKFSGIARAVAAAWVGVRMIVRGGSFG